MSTTPEVETPTIDPDDSPKPMSVEGMKKVDVTADPQATNALIEELISGDVGEHPEPPKVVDGHVQLPGGVHRIDGSFIREAEVCELTGLVEEELERPAVRKNPYRWILTLLEHCVVSIGGEKPDRGELEELIDGDAVALGVGIRQVTYGDTVDVTAACPVCLHEFEVEYDVTEVPTRELKNSDVSWKVPLKKNKIAEVTLPTLGDQLYVNDNVDREAGVAVRNHALLGRCVRNINGAPTRGVSAVQSLPAADIRTLTKFISDKQPGPRFGDVEQKCPKCDSDFPLILGLEDIFRL